MKKRLITTANFVLVALLLYWALLMVATHIPSPKELVGDVRVSDKTVHFVAYAVLAFLAVSALTMRKRLTMVNYFWLTMALFTYGAVDEFAQIPIAGRTADFHDGIANACGVVSGLLVHRSLLAGLDALPWRRKSSADTRIAYGESDAA